MLAEMEKTERVQSVREREELEWRRMEMENESVRVKQEGLCV